VGCRIQNAEIRNDSLILVVNSRRERWRMACQPSSFTQFPRAKAGATGPTSLLRSLVEAQPTDRAIPP